MIEYENECVGCPKEMGCMGDACPNRHVPHYYCDNCGEEIDPYSVFTSDGSDHLCDDCYDKIMGEENEQN